MHLDKFLNLLSLLIGTTGVLLVSKAVLVTPKELLMGTYYYSHIGYPSAEFIESLASPKADAIISVVAIAVAFLIQFVSILVDERTPFVESKVHAILLGVAFVSVGSLLLFFVREGVHSRTVQKTKCMETGNYLQRDLMRELQRPKINPTELKIAFDGLQRMTQEYFRIEKSKAESPADFVRRIAELVEYKPPDGVDLAELDEYVNP